ncbi:MAG TPA: hypothetical protein VIA06_00645 [Candidatus Dormibacteraeota bacterium]|jgi:hypothetical protein|nr:hypothetical protein [Candidatus Dormibacteraeota bacterium]
MDVIDWLMDSDPAIRWQVMRDLVDAPKSDVRAERARVADEGWGARLLALQLEDGHWAGDPPAFDSPEGKKWWESLPSSRRGTLFPQWTSTTWSLVQLRDFGLDRGSPEARRAVGRVRDNVRWEHEGEPFFEGEVEPCINGRTVALGAYFGEDVHGIVKRLLGEQMADGGWNCEQENGSTRGSFHTTIEVLTGFLAYERAGGGSSEVRAARLRGQEYLLERRMLRRLSTGEVINPEWTRFSYPPGWYYDVLRGLDYLRAAEVVPDERVAEAVGLVKSKRDASGRWPLENPHKQGRLHFEVDEGEGRPSRWNTLRAIRVLKWHGGGSAARP